MTRAWFAGYSPLTTESPLLPQVEADSWQLAPLARSHFVSCLTPKSIRDRRRALKAYKRA